VQLGLERDKDIFFNTVLAGLCAAGSNAHARCFQISMQQGVGSTHLEGVHSLYAHFLSYFRAKQGGEHAADISKGGGCVFKRFTLIDFYIN